MRTSLHQSTLTSTKNTAGQLHNALSPLVCPDGHCAFLAPPGSLHVDMCHCTHAHLELAPAGLEREIHLDRPPRCPCPCMVCTWTVPHRNEQDRASVITENAAVVGLCRRGTPLIVCQVGLFMPSTATKHKQQETEHLARGLALQAQPHMQAPHPLLPALPHYVAVSSVNLGSIPHDRGSKAHLHFLVSISTQQKLFYACSRVLGFSSS